MVNLPDDITNKIIMYSIPKYPYLEALKKTRFIRTYCECEGCTEKHRYGCYEFEFNEPDLKRGKICNIIILKQCS